MKALTNQSNHVTVDLVDGHAVTYSHAFAKHFGKSHKDVLRSIRELVCSDDFRRRNFAPSSYLNEQGKAQPSVTLTRDGCTRLIMSFTGTKAGEFLELYIARFNELEAASKVQPDESKIKTKELVQMARFASELVGMQRRCIRLQASLLRVRSQEVRRLGGVPSKPAVKVDGQMELPL